MLFEVEMNLETEKSESKKNEELLLNNCGFEKKNNVKVNKDIILKRNKKRSNSCRPGMCFFSCFQPARNTRSKGRSRRSKSVRPLKRSLIESIETPKYISNEVSKSDNVMSQPIKTPSSSVTSRNQQKTSKKSPLIIQPCIESDKDKKGIKNKKCSWLCVPGKGNKKDELSTSPTRDISKVPPKTLNKGDGIYQQGKSTILVSPELKKLEKSKSSSKSIGTLSVDFDNTKKLGLTSVKKDSRLSLDLGRKSSISSKSSKSGSPKPKSLKPKFDKKVKVNEGKSPKKVEINRYGETLNDVMIFDKKHQMKTLLGNLDVFESFHPNEFLPYDIRVDPMYTIPDNRQQKPSKSPIGKSSASKSPIGKSSASKSPSRISSISPNIFMNKKKPVKQPKFSKSPTGRSKTSPSPQFYGIGVNEQQYSSMENFGFPDESGVLEIINKSTYVPSSYQKSRKGGKSSRSKAKPTALKDQKDKKKPKREKSTSSEKTSSSPKLFGKKKDKDKKKVKSQSKPNSFSSISSLFKHSKSESSSEKNFTKPTLFSKHSSGENIKKNVVHKSIELPYKRDNKSLSKSSDGNSKGWSKTNIKSTTTFSKPKNVNKINHELIYNREICKSPEKDRKSKSSFSSKPKAVNIRDQELIYDADKCKPDDKRGSIKPAYNFKSKFSDSSPKCNSIKETGQRGSRRSSRNCESGEKNTERTRTSFKLNSDKLNKIPTIICDSNDKSESFRKSSIKYHDAEKNDNREATEGGENTLNKMEDTEIPTIQQEDEEEDESLDASMSSRALCMVTEAVLLPMFVNLVDILLSCYHIRFKPCAVRCIRNCDCSCIPLPYMMATEPVNKPSEFSTDLINFCSQMCQKYAPQQKNGDTRSCCSMRSKKMHNCY